MFAFEIPGMRFSVPAGAAVERYRFVSINANSNGIPATNATQVVGASMNKAGVGEVLEVAGGIVMVEAGAAITAGAAVYADASGKATTVEGTANQAGIALTTAANAGDLVTVQI